MNRGHPLLLKLWLTLPAALPHWSDCIATVRARPPLTVNRASHGLVGDEVEAPNMPCTIPIIGFEQPLHFTVLYKQ
jgi:hypothetical protein